MAIQKELMFNQLKNQPPLNRQVYEMVMSIGNGYRASVNNIDMTEAINGVQRKGQMAAIIDENATKMAFALGLSDPQALNRKLKEIKDKLLATQGKNVVTKGDLKKELEKILKGKLKKAFEEAGLETELVEQLEEKEIEEDRKQDQEQNQDLFILKADSERIHEREIEERNAMDRQKQIQEKALRVLEAMEKARDAIEKGKPIPEMDLSYLKELTPQEFSQQMNAFKKFGLEPIAIGKDRTDRNAVEKEISIEDFQNGKAGFAIQYDKLVTPEWRTGVAEKWKALFERNGLEVKYRAETTERDDRNFADARNGNAQRPNQTVEDSRDDR